MRVTVLTGALAACGLGLAAAVSGAPGAPAAAPGAMVPAIAVMLAIAAHLIVRFRHADQTIALDLFESVLAGAIYLFPAPVVVALVGVAIVAVEVGHHRRAVRKIAFNVAQWIAASAGGAAAYAALISRNGNAGIALMAAMLVVAAVNLVAITAVVRVTSRERLATIVRRIGPSIGLSWLTNALFGLVLVALYRWHPAATALFAVVLLVLHGGYRGYASALAGRARMASLQRATHALAEPVDPGDGIAAFLAEVRTCFEAGAAWLVVAADDGARVHAAGRGPGPADGPFVEALARLGAVERIGPRHALAGGLALAGFRDAIVAPLIAEGAILGAVCTFDRSGADGFEAGEGEVLAALAQEAANAVRRGALTREIVEERAALRAIIDGTTDGIATVAADGTVTTWSPGMEQITGYAEDEIIRTRPFDVLQPQDPDGRPVRIEDALATGAELPSEVLIHTRTGETRWLLCSFARAPRIAGRTDELVVIARDHTANHEIDLLKDDFISTVSHELRTPLTPILGWANMLASSADQLSDEQRRRAALSILRQAEGLERLITNLLDMARMQRGVIDIRDNLVEVCEIVDKAVRDARLANPSRVIRLSGVRGCRAACDEIWLERIISNLLSNAVKYSPDQEPVDVRVWADDDGVSIEVTDLGRGIARRDQARIFERFQRLGDHRTRDVAGAGIGLHVSRQLAEAMGASLTVRSEPGAGSTFTLRLPARRSVSAAV